MSTTSNTTPLILFILVVIVTIVAVLIILRYNALARERKRRVNLLKGSRELRPLGDVWKRAEGRGQIPIAVVGTYGAHLLPSILKAFERTGTTDHVGTILLIELDDDVRQSCLDNIPTVFRNRVIEVDCPLLPSGLLNNPIEQVLRDRAYWETNVLRGTRDWLARMQRETRPSTLICLLSPGGHAALGRPALDAFHSRYPLIPIYALTILDDKRQVRHEFANLRAHYDHNDLIRGWIITDNWRDSLRADLGMAALIGGMTGGSWVGERQPQLWNGLPPIFPGNQPKGGFATISVWAETLPVYYLPAFGKVLSEVYYTTSDLVREKIIRATQELVENPDLQAVSLPPDVEHQRYIHAITPVIPTDLKETSEWVKDGLKPYLKDKPNLGLSFVSMSAPLAPSTTEVPIIVVLVQRLAGDSSVIDHFALETHPALLPTALAAVPNSATPTSPSIPEEQTLIYPPILTPQSPQPIEVTAITPSASSAVTSHTYTQSAQPSEKEI